MRKVDPVTTDLGLRAAIKAAPFGRTTRIHIEPNLVLEVRRPDNGKGRDATTSPKCAWVYRWAVLNGVRRDGTIGKLDMAKTLGRYFPEGYKAAGRKAHEHMGLEDARKAASAHRDDLKKSPTRDLRRLKRLKRVETDNREAAALADRLAREAAEAEAAEKSARTVQAACEEWHDKTAHKLSSPKYAAQRLRRLQDFCPHIGGVPVADLKPEHVSTAFDAMLQAVAEKGRGHSGAETLRRSSADLEKAWAYAAGKGWCSGSNPVTTARANLDKPKVEGRRLFDPERLPEFGAALDAIETKQRAEGRRYPVTVQLLRMLTLTAARTLEVRGLRWSEVEDLDGAAPLVRVPASRMKRRSEWTIPLSPAAADVLLTVRAWQAEAGAGLKGVEAGLVFVHLEGNYKGRGLSENAANDLLQEMKWSDDLTAHGLRKVFSTIAHDQWPYHGPNRTEAIEYSLAHAPADKVRGIYDKNDFVTKRRELLAWWAEQVGKRPAPAVAVVEAEEAPAPRMRRVK